MARLSLADPGPAPAVNFFDPTFYLEVGGVPISEEINRFIKTVEFESCDCMLDVMKLDVINAAHPKTGKLLFTDAKAWQPGNEINLALGYGNQTKHIGRFVIARLNPSFPRDGQPMLEITGYPKSFLMMDNEPPKGKAKRRIFKAEPGKPVMLDDIVNEVASRYGFEVDLGPASTTDEKFPKSVAQRHGVKDYEFLQALANLRGFVFYVDGEQGGQWTLHFLKPDAKGRTPAPRSGTIQDRMFTFEYGRGEASTLFTFEPEYAFRGSKTKIVVMSRNAFTGKEIELEIEEDALAPDTQVHHFGDPTDDMSDPYCPPGAEIKLIFGDEFAVDIVSDKYFSTDLELGRWAKEWFRKHRQEFVQSNGTTIGIETLACRQVHKLVGIGTSYEGEYYLSRVRHMLDENGYYCEFSARKVLA